MLAATQCSAVRIAGGKEVAVAQRIQTRGQPSQKGAEESQSEARRGQRGQDRVQRGSDQQSRTGRQVCTGLEMEVYYRGEYYLMLLKIAKQNSICK